MAPTIVVVAIRVSTMHLCVVGRLMISTRWFNFSSSTRQETPLERYTWIQVFVIMFQLLVAWYIFRYVSISFSVSVSFYLLSLFTPFPSLAFPPVPWYIPPSSRCLLPPPPCIAQIYEAPVAWNTYQYYPFSSSLMKSYKKKKKMKITKNLLF
eukprot:Phypoly_transcript_16987.p2 GENE.Phypoly_transcript_16987~~Phypoly_transcript_16987.p2  ORF type:complete len:153 (+),score=12.59 Phypoly_transcript_16987:285-743(+)